ncbi:MAG: NAD(+)/NADH kinase [Candidatus Delongbacteria bacterium]|nr:NAD(+)/NADH kinase [Candidatus Delongbacteria bacterium]MBN2835840.1 NAD(+)/NADH kinase [Candidatus Delongbacteria bacterium]
MNCKYKYGLIHNMSSEKEFNDICSVLNWLKSMKLTFCCNKDFGGGFDVLDYKEVIKNSDIYIVFGGDGSILKIARDSILFDRRILGVNLGKLGFLADTNLVNLRSSIQKIENEDFFIEKRIMLTASFGGKYYSALNDIVIDKGASSRLIKIDVKVNNKYLTTYTSDGLIISTPTGSTAYNLSASGPIMEPGVRGMIINPISPHALAMRPVIVSDLSELSIEASSENGKMVISADGQENSEIDSYELITVKKSDHFASFIKFHNSDYYKILREKLGWGGFKKRYVK